MKINTKVRYGLRAALQIAEQYGGDPVPVSAISHTQEISGKYLEQVIGALRRAGLLESRKGVRGGYVLARPPAEVTLWDIISALDPHTSLVECVVDPAVCDRADECLTRSIWTLLSRRLEEFWSGFTLSDLIQTMGDTDPVALTQLKDYGSEG